MTCRVFQWLISLARDRGSEPAAFVLHHIAGCAECHRFFIECSAMETKLRGESGGAPEVMLPTLHAGIMRAVRTSVPETSEATLARPPMWRAAAVVGVALILGYVAFVMSPARKGTLEQGESVLLAEVHSQLSAATVEAPALVVAPMEREMDNLEDDVRRTTEYLLAQLDY